MKKILTILLTVLPVVAPLLCLCQEPLDLIPDINADKPVVCKGDTATLKIQYSRKANENGIYEIWTEDVRTEERGCSGIGCTLLKNIAPVITGDGIVSVNITRRGCGEVQSILSTIIIKVRPSVTTKYEISWEAKWYASADPECGLEERIFQWRRFKGSIEITVADQRPPDLTPASANVNIGGPSVPVTATAYFNSSGIREIQWFQNACGKDNYAGNSYPDIYHNSAAFDVVSYPLGAIKLRAKKNDGGCLSDFSKETVVTVKPCHMTPGGCNQDDVTYVEANSCDPAAEKRSDHHFYEKENTVCKGSGCNAETVWQFLKSRLDYEIPTQTDMVNVFAKMFGTKTNLFLSKALFPDEDFSGPVQDNCTVINLPTPFSFAVNLASGTPATAGAFIFKQINPLGLYSDPVFLRIDESNKCITNYTGKGHIFYPGKVTRCVQQQCDEVKILTFGEGTSLGDKTPLGEFLAGQNQRHGPDIFQHVDDRFIGDYRRRTGGGAGNGSITGATADILPGKTWKIAKFQLKSSSDGSLINVFESGDSTHFWNMDKADLRFSGNGRYAVTDVLGGNQTGYWRVDSAADLIWLDTIACSVVFSGPDKLIVKGITGVARDTAFMASEYLMTLVPKDYVLATGISKINLSEKNCRVEVSFTTDDQPAGGYFELQRRSSEGAGLWLKIAVLKPANTGGRQTYRYTDTADAPGVNFYRVRQAGRSGEANFSPTASLNVTCAGNNAVRYYPNPVNDRLTILLPPGTARYTVRICDAAGRPVYSSTAAGGLNLIPFTGRAAGFYLLEVNAGDKIICRGKLIKY